MPADPSAECSNRKMHAWQSQVGNGGSGKAPLIARERNGERLTGTQRSPRRQQRATTRCCAPSHLMEVLLRPLAEELRVREEQAPRLWHRQRVRPVPPRHLASPGRQRRPRGARARLACLTARCAIARLARRQPAAGRQSCAADKRQSCLRVRHARIPGACGRAVHPTPAARGVRTETLRTHALAARRPARPPAAQRLARGTPRGAPSHARPRRERAALRVRPSAPPWGGSPRAELAPVGVDARNGQGDAARVAHVVAHVAAAAAVGAGRAAAGSPPPPRARASPHRWR